MFIKSCRLILMIAAFAVGIAFFPHCAEAKEEAKAGAIKVLIVDGFSNHDWQLTTRSIEEILRPTGLFEVTVSTSPPTSESPGWEQWRPKFKDYDVVIQNCNDINQRISWPSEVQSDFEKFVREGGGIYIFHSAQNAFAQWPAYNEIIGMGWRSQDVGTALTVDDHQQIVRIPPGEGEGTGHGARGEVVVHLLGNHPIHEGMPQAWKTPGLEVYDYPRGPAHNVEVLSYGRGRNNRNWPIEWTVMYGLGRAYVATFGHVWAGDKDPESMRCAGVQTSIVRALQWLAGKPVTFPVPPDFPTESAVSIRPALPLR